MSYANEAGQNDIGQAMVEKLNLPNAFFMDEVDFPYQKCPKEGQGEEDVTVFPISELENMKRNWPWEIKLPSLEHTEENVQACYSVCKGPFSLIRSKAYITSIRKREVNLNREQYESRDEYNQV